MVQHSTIDHTGLTGAGGSVATDTLWDAAGDLAVGSGANTAAKLALGAAGGALSRVNGAVAWNSGTSFPTAATGDRYWRTDLAREAYYDGTRWLGVEVPGPVTPVDAQAATGATPNFGRCVIPNDFDIYVTTIDMSTFVATTNNGSNYWTVSAYKVNAANSLTSLGSFNTSGDTASNWTHHEIDVNAVVDKATYFGLSLGGAKTAGAPGAISWMVQFRYRLVLT